MHSFDFNKAFDAAKAELANHVRAPVESRAARFKDPRGNFNWFNVTWSPGQFSLMGDLGEFSLTHYHACADYWDGLYWLEGSDYGYLMEKSGVRQGYDRDKTLAALIEMANEEAVATLRHYRDERRDYRRTLATANSADPAVSAEYHYSLDGEDEELGPFWWPFEECHEPLSVTESNHVYHHTHPYGSYLRSSAPKHEVPDGFDLWYKLQQYFDVADCSPEEILTAKGRRALREALADHLDELGPDEVARFTNADLGLDDYYYSTSYPDRSIIQVAALQHAAKALLAEMPLHVRVKRAWRAARNTMKGFKEFPVHVRPALLKGFSVTRSGDRHARSGLYIAKLRGEGDQAWTQYCEVKPWKVRGKVVPGCWRECGSYCSSTRSELIWEHAGTQQTS